MMESINPTIESANPKAAVEFTPFPPPVERINSTTPTIPSGSPRHIQHSTQLIIPTIKQANENCSSFIYPPYIKSFRHIDPYGLIFIL